MEQNDDRTSHSERNWGFNSLVHFQSLSQLSVSEDWSILVFNGTQVISRDIMWPVVWSCHIQPQDLLLHPAMHVWLRGSTKTWNPESENGNGITERETETGTEYQIRNQILMIENLRISHFIFYYNPKTISFSFLGSSLKYILVIVSW